MRRTLVLLLAGCATPAPRVVPGWAPRVDAPSPRVGTQRPPRLEVNAEAVWWLSGDGVAREALATLDAGGLPGDVARFSQRVREALGARLSCDGGRVSLEVGVTAAARMEALYRVMAGLPVCAAPSLGLAGDPRPALRVARVGGPSHLVLRQVAQGWQVDVEGQPVAPGCLETSEGAVTVGPTEGDGGGGLRACARTLATAPSLRPWFSVQNQFVVAATRDATMGEVFSAASAFALGVEPVARDAQVVLALASRPADGDREPAGAPRPLVSPIHVPAHDRQLGALQDALSACAADGAALEVAGSFGADSGRFVAFRPMAGSPSARVCAQRALGEVTLAPPQLARTDLVWRFPLPAGRAPDDAALARRMYASFGARMPRVRACYEAALRSDVQQGGRVEVEALVAENGVVLGVTTRSSPSLGEAAACIAGVLATSDGGEAMGGSFTLTFPLALVAAR